MRHQASSIKHQAIAAIDRHTAMSPIKLRTSTLQAVDVDWDWDETSSFGWVHKLTRFVDQRLASETWRGIEGTEG